MDKPTHYVEARILPLDGQLLSRGDMAFVTSRIMSAVHLAIVSGLNISVSFPEFREKLVRNNDGQEVQLAGIGKTIRFFGSMNELMAFIVRPDFACLIGEAACRLVGSMPIREIPQMVSWEIYSRNRKVERTFAGFVERANRRNHKNGRKLIDVGADNSNKHRSHHAHFNVSSSSTGQKFCVFLDREDVNEFLPGTLSSYGIGVGVPVF